MMSIPWSISSVKTISGVHGTGIRLRSLQSSPEASQQDAELRAVLVNRPLRGKG